MPICFQTQLSDRWGWHRGGGEDLSDAMRVRNTIVRERRNHKRSPRMTVWR